MRRVFVIYCFVFNLTQFSGVKAKMYKQIPAHAGSKELTCVCCEESYKLFVLKYSH